jgi:hypothetical protein
LDFFGLPFECGGKEAHGEGFQAVNALSEVEVADFLLQRR